jgi:hypothetical protein
MNEREFEFKLSVKMFVPIMDKTNTYIKSIKNSEFVLYRRRWEKNDVIDFIMLKIFSDYIYRMRMKRDHYGDCNFIEIKL